MMPFIAFGAALFAMASETEEAPPRRRRDQFGGAPPMPMAQAPAAGVLRSAALSAPGSWTRRGVLQRGAASSMQRRMAGTASEADFAVLRAARPGIASRRSGPISRSWGGSPWQGGSEGGVRQAEGVLDLESIGDQVASSLGDWL